MLHSDPIPIQNPTFDFTKEIYANTRPVSVSIGNLYNLLFSHSYKPKFSSETLVVGFCSCKKVVIDGVHHTKENSGSITNTHYGEANVGRKYAYCNREAVVAATATATAGDAAREWCGAVCREQRYQNFRRITW
jgi:hypothetical protein